MAGLMWEEVHSTSGNGNWNNGSEQTSAENLTSCLSNEVMSFVFILLRGHGTSWIYGLMSFTSFWETTPSW